MEKGEAPVLKKKKPKHWHTRAKDIARRKQEVAGQLIEFTLFEDDPNDTGAPLRKRHDHEALIERLEENLMDA